MDPFLELAMYIKAGQREIERIMNEAMRPLGITAAQADALVVIGQTERIALKELGGLLIAEAGHPSRLVDRLVDAKLVKREESPEDRRRIELSLTPGGRTVERRVRAVRKEILAFGGEILAGRDAEPLLGLGRDLLTAVNSPLVEVIERRRELERDEPREGG